MKQVAALAVFAILMTGCAFTPHKAKVSIDQPKIAPSTTAQGTTIRLKVVDERDDQDLGRRGAGIAVAKVRAEGLMPQFTQAVEEGFRKKGFELINDTAAADAELLVVLRALKFEESAGFFTVGAEADATILAEAKRGDEDYRNQYRSSDEDRQFAISFGGGIDEQLSLVLNDVLAQLFNDKRLDDFLTGN
ncbi:hypothetical protein GWO43_25635 [candidate division KSB1 bacterium]|nr:hypothetical protein [candidate division KSB1 bacterium]NIR71037.1 hypothetical protein [candidate division KSB1 bacterium]NIS23260.1 hypothetical protein [candidate division KSB1 bacterium]NIT74194.1 hypothetical protein [candidate division KSB1 bacterium]NIU28074.1 hypothetical protein [candidate division KSB1 bacterium]